MTAKKSSAKPIPPYERIFGKREMARMKRAFKAEQKRSMEFLALLRKKPCR